MSNPMPPATSSSGKDRRRNRSTVRHTRAIQVARSKLVPSAPPAAAVTEHLCELVQPAIYGQMRLYHDLGLRARLLTLPVMTAVILTMIWRQVGSVCELTRMLNQEQLLWQPPVIVSQQALSKRLLDFPACLFRGVLEDLSPTLEQRWSSRARPLPEEIAHARAWFKRSLIFDGSTLDGLWRKLDGLRWEPIEQTEERPPTPLGGRMGALLHLGSRLPVKIWYEPDPAAHDLRFADLLLETLEADDLLVVDAGLIDYDLFDRLTDKGVAFIARPKSNTVMRAVKVLQNDEDIYDAVVEVGSPGSRCRHLMRHVKIKHGTGKKAQWYAYLTNVLDREKLPARYVAALYRRRWRIEQAFGLVKRLLGLAYLWVGTQNGVALQVWATWLLCAVLTDLTDAVAQELDVPTETVSFEMCFRGLYHFTTAYQMGKADDPIVFLAQKARLLGIIKRPRKKTGSDSSA